MAENYGVTTLGTLDSSDFIASLRQPRQIYGTVKKVDDGAVFERGTLFSKDTVDGFLVKHDGTLPIFGVSNEVIDTTGGNVKSYFLFDFDANVSAVLSATTVAVGYDSASLINFVEVK